MLQKNCCWKELSICFSSELQHSPDTKAIGEWNFQLLKCRRWTLKALIDIWDFKLRCSCSQTSCLAPAAPHTTMRGSTAWPPELTAEYFKIITHFICLEYSSCKPRLLWSCSDIHAARMVNRGHVLSRETVRASRQSWTALGFVCTDETCTGSTGQSQTKLHRHSLKNTHTTMLWDKSQCLHHW